MEEADLYFVDTRNATTDHRTGAAAPGGRPPSGRPISVVQVPGGGSTRVYSAPPQSMYPYGNPYANPYGNPYMNPYLPPQSTLASNLLGRISTGQIIDLVAQIFAALMPLPGAPTATADASTDVGNLILYQGALAQYAKRDEQVRTLGNLVTKLVG
jgi:hypothetical protein